MKIACLVLAICVAAANAKFAPLLRAKERIDGRYIIGIKVGHLSYFVFICNMDVYFSIYENMSSL